MKAHLTAYFKDKGASRKVKENIMHLCYMVGWM